MSKDVVVKAVENLKLQRKEPKMTVPGAPHSGMPRIRMPVLIPAIVICVGAIGFLIFQNVRGQQAYRAKRTLESRLAQERVSGQIERARLKQEISKLEEEVEEVLKAKVAAPKAQPPVAVPDQWKDSYTIFLGVFNDRKSAVEKVKGLRGVKQKAHIITLSTGEGGKEYNLVLGNFKNPEEATDVLNDVQIQGKLLDAEVKPFADVLSSK
jgi:cell division septation protein DedD